jgi:hypothetical protein
VLTGGRNSSQKAQKGLVKTKIWPEEFLAKSLPNFTKNGRKGAGENFLKRFLILQL